MKPTSAILSLIFTSALAASAQGVFLGPGEALSFGFDGVSGCRTQKEAAPGGSVYVIFGNDTLAAGESLRVEMFENNLNEAPVLVQTYSPSASRASVYLENQGSWLDYQGLIRVTMLTGSVDVDYGHFFVRPDPFSLCDSFVVVPEPHAFVLIAFSAFSGAAAALLWICRLRNA